MARNDPQVNFRIPAQLNDLLKEAAANNNRTITAELVHRLESSFALGDDVESALHLRRRLARYREFWTEMIEVLGAARETLIAAKVAGATASPSFSSPDGRTLPIENSIAEMAETIEYFVGQRDQATLLLAEIAFLDARGKPMTDAGIKKAIADRKIELPDGR